MEKNNLDKKTLTFLKQLIKQDVLIEWTSEGAIVIFNPSETAEFREKKAYKFDRDDLSGFRDMLYDIRDIMYPGGKYDKERVEIKLKHGHAYECKDPNCKICTTLYE